MPFGLASCKRTSWQCDTQFVLKKSISCLATPNDVNHSPYATYTLFFVVHRFNAVIWCPQRSNLDKGRDLRRWGRRCHNRSWAPRLKKKYDIWNDCSWRDFWASSIKPAGSSWLEVIIDSATVSYSGSTLPSSIPRKEFWSVLAFKGLKNYRWSTCLVSVPNKRMSPVLFLRQKLSATSWKWYLWIWKVRLTLKLFIQLNHFFLSLNILLITQKIWILVNVVKSLFLTTYIIFFFFRCSWTFWFLP